MNRFNSKTHHQLKFYKNYNHINVSGVLVVFGLLTFFGIPAFPKNLLVSLLFFLGAITSYKLLKTTKPIFIHKDHICLGKMVNGYKETDINAKAIASIDLVYEVKTEFRAVAALNGGDEDVHSNYFQIKLKNNNHIRFDNQYDKQLQDDLKQWCEKNNIEINLDVKKVIQEDDDY